MYETIESSTQIKSATLTHYRTKLNLLHTLHGHANIYNLRHFNMFLRAISFVRGNDLSYIGLFTPELYKTCIIYFYQDDRL